MKDGFTRRDFLKRGGMAAAGVAALGTITDMTIAPKRAHAEGYTLDNYIDLPGDESEYDGYFILPVLKRHGSEMAYVLSRESVDAIDQVPPPESYIIEQVGKWCERNYDKIILTCATTYGKGNPDRQYLEFIPTAGKGTPNEQSFIDVYRMNAEPKMYIEGMFQEALPIGSEIHIGGDTLRYIRDQENIKDGGKTFNSSLKHALKGGAKTLNNVMDSFSWMYIPTGYAKAGANTPLYYQGCLRSLNEFTKWTKSVQETILVSCPYNDEGLKIITIKATPEGRKELIGLIQPTIDNFRGLNVMGTVVCEKDGKKYNAIGLAIE